MLPATSVDFVTLAALGADAGGTLTGPADDFANGVTRAAWVAAYILFIMWLILLLFSPLYQRPQAPSHPSSLPVQPAGPPGVGLGGGADTERGTTGQDEPEGSETGTPPAPTSLTQSQVPSKLTNMVRAGRDGFLIVFGAVLVSMAGFGVTAGPLVLLWIVLGLICLWILTQLLPTSFAWIIDILLTLPILVLLIIVWGLAWRNAPFFSTSIES
ncbi:hypothetical protein BDK51DRAFT_27530 [Blyttiomyces helicus]|uniref:Uncharacterized protein n=1 Tax=Blyttiomyces helicus TaxID=388810 RepID=A0A4P9WB47_9FUNG|nr:hypothetical protein BDK51DRAFT_27530 [Blyttiomyces helicus]|eukprot:RKO88763.1 hypothetical protein BDK51DRAFT_27530 [Blyttiomyces helicus]